MSDLNEQQLNKVLQEILLCVAIPSIKSKVQALLREVAVTEFDIVSGKTRQQILEGYDQALEYWTHDYLIESKRPPKATLNFDGEDA